MTEKKTKPLFDYDYEDKVCSGCGRLTNVNAWFVCEKCNQ